MRHVLNYAERFHSNNKTDWLKCEEEYSNMLKLLEEQSHVLKCEKYSADTVFNLNKMYCQLDKE